MNARLVKPRSPADASRAATVSGWLSDRSFSHIIWALAAALAAITAAQLTRILAGSDDSKAALILIVPVFGLMLVAGRLATQSRRDAALHCMTAALFMMQFTSVFVQGFGIHGPALWGGGLMGSALAFSVLPARRAFLHAAVFLAFALCVLFVNDLDIMPPDRWNRIPPDSNVMAGVVVVTVLGGRLVLGLLAHIGAIVRHVPDHGSASAQSFMPHASSEPDQCVSLKGLFDQLHSEFAERLSEKNLHLAFNMTTRSPDLVLANRDRLLDILRPLLDNAIRYTHDGGVMLGISNRVNGDPACWRIDVVDSGIGMRGDTVVVLNERLASPTRHPVSNGKAESAGGLYSVAAAVNALGGHSGVSSMAGFGSTFWVYLRLKPAEGDVAQAPQTAGEGRARH